MIINLEQKDLAFSTGMGPAIIPKLASPAEKAELTRFIPSVGANKEDLAFLPFIKKGKASIYRL